MHDSTGSAILAWLRDHEADMLRLLEEIVNIDSGSKYKEGVDRVGTVLRDHLQRAGIPTRPFPQASHGDCLLAEIPGSDAGQTGYVLLLGHMDTVFPEGTAGQRPFRIDGTTAYGPGVADMKAGLVMNTFIAQAFAEIGGNAAPIRLLCTGDEEIASPSSRGVTTEIARQALAVFNAEPGRPTGNVVTGRKGALFIDFEVEGVAAHAGVNHDQGASAIEALAHKIIDLRSIPWRRMQRDNWTCAFRPRSTANSSVPGFSTSFREAAWHAPAAGLRTKAVSYPSRPAKAATACCRRIRKRHSRSGLPSRANTPADRPTAA